MANQREDLPSKTKNEPRHGKNVSTAHTAQKCAPTIEGSSSPTANLPACFNDRPEYKSPYPPLRCSEEALDGSHSSSVWPCLAPHHGVTHYVCEGCHKAATARLLDNDPEIFHHPWLPMCAQCIDAEFSQHPPDWFHRCDCMEVNGQWMCCEHRDIELKGIKEARLRAEFENLGLAQTEWGEFVTTRACHCGSVDLDLEDRARKCAACGMIVARRRE